MEKWNEEYCQAQHQQKVSQAFALWS